MAIRFGEMSDVWLRYIELKGVDEVGKIKRVRRNIVPSVNYMLV